MKPLLLILGIITLSLMGITLTSILNAYIRIVSSMQRFYLFKPSEHKREVQNITRCTDGSMDCYTDVYAENLMTEDGIVMISSGHCSNPNLASCTSLERVHRRVIDYPYGVRALNDNSSCVVHITGGTEILHSSLNAKYSSRNGWLLNLRHINEEGRCLTQYIKKHFPAVINGTLNGRQTFYCGPGDVLYMEVVVSADAATTHNPRWNVNYGSGCSFDALLLNIKLAFGPTWQQIHIP